jgi:RNA polymerase sigma-70 factor, ECF subfamily
MTTNLATWPQTGLLYSPAQRCARVRVLPKEHGGSVHTNDRERPDDLKLDDLPSVELIRRAKGGDERALDRLFERYLPIMRRWAGGRLPRWARDMVDTDDMVQETLVKAYRNVGTFEPRHDGAVGAYLRQALNNRLRDEIRKVHARPQRVEMDDDHRDHRPSPLEEAIGRDALERYEGAMARLEEDERELILTRIEMGLSFKEVAAATNRPSEDAARMAVNRALVRLATEMGHE